MITAQSYEIMRFVEHGGKCRTIMDCASGRLLIQRLGDQRGITKEQVFKWFRGITGELEKYHRCREGQLYRYLNPYSILVTDEEEIVLLDLSTASNGFVMEKMQQPQMRKHFIRITVQSKDDSGLAVDLYSLGMTIQFILAYTEAYISLTRREEYLLSRVIEKCLGENPKKRYENLRQVQRELPIITTCKQKNKQQKRRILDI